MVAAGAPPRAPGLPGDGMTGNTSAAQAACSGRIGVGLVGRATNRYAARRDAALLRMAGDVTLPARDAGESHGAYFRRCALVWLAAPGERDQDLRADVLRLGALASRPPGLRAVTPDSPA